MYSESFKSIFHHPFTARRSPATGGRSFNLVVQGFTPLAYSILCAAEPKEVKMHSSEQVSRMHQQNTLSRRAFMCRTLVLGISSATLPTLLANCAPAPAAPGSATEGEEAAPGGETVELVYWTVLGNVDGIIMDALVQQFSAENPDIEIESLQGVEEFEAKLQSSVLTGTGPDVTLYRLHYVGPYAAREIVLPMDAGELGDAGVVGENFDSRVWEATFYQGEQFAIPFDIHLFALFRNTKLFADGGLDPESPPTTLDEWYSMAEALNQGDVVGTAVYSWPPGMFWIYYGLMKQFGGELFLDEGTRVDLTTPAHIEPVQWWHDLRWNINPEAKNGDLTRTGMVGLWLDGPWTLSLWSDPERSQIVSDYAISMLPQHDPENPAVWANSHCFSLPKPQAVDAAKQAAAVRLMKWLAEHSYDWSDQAGQIPASNLVRESEAWLSGDGQILQGSRQFAEALPYAHYFPQHPMFFEVSDRIAAALDAAINTQTTTPEAAMQQATDEINQILAQGA
jgi:multiple sugar transport system substrate-binding protein